MKSALFKRSMGGSRFVFKAGYRLDMVLIQQSLITYVPPPT
jgi:hypothetical protein